MSDLGYGKDRVKTTTIPPTEKPTARISIRTLAYVRTSPHTHRLILLTGSKLVAALNHVDVSQRPDEIPARPGYRSTIAPRLRHRKAPGNRQ